AMQGHVRPEGVMPANGVIEKGLEIETSAGNSNLSQPFVLNAPNQTFANRDAAVLADRAITRLDLFALEPTAEVLPGKLRSLVADEVLRCLAARFDGRFDDLPNRL